MKQVIQRAYKCELRPTNEQVRLFWRCCGTARYVYNWALNYSEEQRKQTGKRPHHRVVRNTFNSIKDELCRDEEGHVWIRDVSSDIITSECDNLGFAFSRFFAHVKEHGVTYSGRKDGKPDHYPRFKSRYKGAHGFRLQKPIVVEYDHIRLPRIGAVRLQRRGYIPTEGIKINSATVSERAGKWFVSVQCEQEIDITRAKGQPLGVDVGIHALAAVSDGRIYDNPKALAKYEEKLKRLQRQLSRQQKGGANYRKTKAKIAKLHYRIACIRQYALHQASAGIVNSGARPRKRPRVVVIEDLNVKGMMQNGKLAKAIGDASMGELHRQLAYKAAWNGIEVVKSDRWFASSKTCSRCGAVNHDLKLSDRVYRCPHCGLVMDRDVNAARNLEQIA